MAEPWECKAENDQSEHWSPETRPFSVHRKKCPREARITGCSLHHLWREIRYSQFRLQPLRPDVACQQARTATNFQYAGNQWKPPLCSKFRQRLSGNALYPGAVLITEGRGAQRQIGSASCRERVWQYG